MDAHSLASPDLFARRLRDLCGELARGDYDNIDSLFAMTADAEAPETVPQSLRRSHDGGPLNHP